MRARAGRAPTDVFNNLISVQVSSRRLTNDASFKQAGSELQGAATVFIGIFILGAGLSGRGFSGGGVGGGQTRSTTVSAATLGLPV